MSRESCALHIRGVCQVWKQALPSFHESQIRVHEFQRTRSAWKQVLRMKEKSLKIKKRKTYELRLTRSELVHLRDLFSVVLPPDARKTMSQALAELEDRSVIESHLWSKVSELCSDANLPLDNDAPDYIIAPIAPPPMSVFPLTSDAEELEEPMEG